MNALKVRIVFGAKGNLWENRMGGFRKGGFSNKQICPQTRRRNSKRSVNFK